MDYNTVFKSYDFLVIFKEEKGKVLLYRRISDKVETMIELENDF